MKENQALYRPEIDGLRAMAVVAVLLHHTHLIPLTGGFLGVDVFFVISGYLISRVIVGELEKGSFSLLLFYERRARRLLPLLLLVLLVSSVFVWHILLPDDLVEYAKSLLASLFFSSNVWFYFEDSYHAAESLKKPLLHTWSLGVEEQFYLLYPLFLLVLTRFSANLRLTVVLALLVVSLLLAQSISKSNAEFAFYLLPTRAWELLFGAIVFFISSNRVCSQQYFSLLGLMLIVLAYVLFDQTTAHPSVFTLAPVIGAALILLCDSKDTLVWKFLSNKIMVWLGKLSYALYLWHFPVLAIALIGNEGEKFSVIDRLGYLAIILMLAIGSHYLVEKPFRFGAKRYFYSVVSFALIGLMAFSFLVIKESGFSERMSTIESILAGTNKDSLSILKDDKLCLIKRNGQGCRFDNSPQAKKIINIGDSHAYQMNRSLLALAELNSLNFETMNLTHCPYIRHAWRITGFKAKCLAEYQETVRNYLLSQAPSIITYIVRFPLYLNPSNYDNGEGGVERSQYLPFYVADNAPKGSTVESLIIETINELANHGHQIVLVYPIPELGWNLPNLVRDRLQDVPVYQRKAMFRKMDITTSYELYKQRALRTKKIYDAVDNKNVVRVFPEQIFCSRSVGRCRAHNDEVVYYRDNNHLSVHGSKLLSNLIAKELGLMPLTSKSVSTDQHSTTQRH